MNNTISHVDIEQLSIDRLGQVKNTVISFLTNYGFQVFGALLILGIGLFICRWLGAFLQKRMEGKDIEPPVKILVIRIAKLIVLALTMVLVAEKFGVPVTSLAVGLGTVGVGIGLAMQGVLSNLVAGLVIIFTKPFRVGEYIELLSERGQVVHIELFSTVLTHADRSRVLIPNRKIVGEILHNYGRMRQLDLSVGVGYGSDLHKVQSIVRELLNANPRVLKDPEPFVGVTALGDSTITISIKPWVKLEDYGATRSELNVALIEKFRAADIEIPFPQREIRVLNNPANVAKL